MFQLSAKPQTLMELQYPSQSGIRVVPRCHSPTDLYILCGLVRIRERRNVTNLSGKVNWQKIRAEATRIRMIINLQPCHMVGILGDERFFNVIQRRNLPLQR
jgi:hypothetical protein